MKLDVAIELLALPVGEDAPEVAELAVRFDLDQNPAEPWLGRSAEPQPFEVAAGGLAPGVHLHWLLPPELRRGTASEQGELTFPAVPDRWHVRRWGGGRDAAWVVESDRLWRTGTASPWPGAPDPNEQSATVLHLPDRLADVAYADVLHRRLGRAFPAAGWAEDDRDVERLRPLTALGSGLPAFAAVLAHCYNVFGLWDPLDDLLGDAQQLTYEVVGTYARPADDPLCCPKPADAIARAVELGWRPVGSTEPAPTATRLVGRLQRVPWRRAATRPPARAWAGTRVAVAASPSRAVAQLVAETVVRAELVGPAVAPAVAARVGVAADVTASEVDQIVDLLDVLALGRAGRLLDAAPGVRLTWDEAIHDSGFARVPGGTTWTLVAPVVPPTPPEPPVPPVPAAAPLVLAPLLLALHRAQGSMDGAQRAVDGARDRLFADWCNLLEHRPVDEPRRYDAAGWRQLRIGAAAVADLVAARHDATARRDAALATLGAAGGTELVPTAVPAAPFGAPADLVLALTAPPEVPFDRARATAEPDGPSWTDASAGRPVLLDWQVAFEDAAPMVGGRLDPAALHLEAAAPVDGRVEQAVVPARLTGSVPLVVHPLDPLRNRAAELAHDLPPAFGAALRLALQKTTELRETVAVAALSGANEALLGRRRSVELPVLDPHAPDVHGVALAGRVRQALGLGPDGRGAPGATARGTQRARWAPLRQGTVRLRGLRAIDSFGRPTVLLDADHGDDRDATPSSRPVVDATDVRWPLALRVHGSPEVGRLPARLPQPARLALRTVPPLEAIPAGAPGPVLGWLVTNRVDHSLAVHDPDGTPLGSLHPTGALWRGAVGRSYGRPFVQRGGSALDALLRRLLDANDGDASTGRQPLQDLVEALDEMTDHVLPVSHAQQGGLATLVGRPLALVPATLAVELAGPPAVDLSIDAFPAWARTGVRRDLGWDRLAVPVSLGLRGHLDDGLIGAFVRGDHALTSAAGEDGDAPDPVLALTPGGKPVPLVLVVDPRSPVHASTDVLPTTTLALPPEHWSPALATLGVDLAVGPILAPAADDPEGLAIPLPEEPGLVWELVHGSEDPGVVDDTWRVRPASGVAPVDGLDLDHQLYDGWLRLRPRKDDDA